MKLKSERCSTGHGTGLIMPKTIGRPKRIRLNPTRNQQKIENLSNRVRKMFEEKEAHKEIANRAWEEQRRAETRPLLTEAWRRLKIWWKGLRRGRG